MQANAHTFASKNLPTRGEVALKVEELLSSCQNRMECHCKILQFIMEQCSPAQPESEIDQFLGMTFSCNSREASHGKVVDFIMQEMGRGTPLAQKKADERKAKVIKAFEDFLSEPEDIREVVWASLDPSLVEGLRKLFAQADAGSRDEEAKPNHGQRRKTRIFGYVNDRYRTRKSPVESPERVFYKPTRNHTVPVALVDEDLG